ncbi:MAG: PqqD family protein [Clostridia bacterium]|nr:PqqD family protein [Clostridia bacterium]
MKQKFLLREIDGEYLLVPLGNSNQQFTSLITMNETGAFIWKRLEQNKTPEQIATDLSKEYKVSFDKAKADVIKFIAYLQSKGFTLHF